MRNHWFMSLLLEKRTATKPPEDPSAHLPMPKYADTHTFIVRIWQENAGESPVEHGWRGLILHVGSDRRQYFFALSDVSHFIQEQTGSIWTARPPWWQGILNWLRKGKN
jgi:hypothetical protein